MAHCRPLRMATDQGRKVKRKRSEAATPHRAAADRALRCHEKGSSLTASQTESIGEHPHRFAVGMAASGALEITEIKIAPEAIDPDDPELLADMVLAAVNEALRSAQSLAESKLGNTLGGLKGLGLPGL